MQERYEERSQNFCFFNINPFSHDHPGTWPWGDQGAAAPKFVLSPKKSNNTILAAIIL